MVARWLGAAVAIAMGGGLSCRGGAPAPEVQPMPAPDTRPALLAGGAAAAPPVASYRIEASLDAETHRIRGRETLTWVNPGKGPVSALPFHLYLNAFKNESSVFMQESGGAHRGVHASEDSWGWIDVDKVTVDGGADVTARVEWPGPDETVMRLPLDTPVAPGAQIVVAMEFEAHLPELFARTGYEGDFHMVGQWFPKIGVLAGAPGEGEAWHCEPFHYLSEFFADFGTYDVALTVPDTMVVAATGVLAAVSDAPDGTRTLTYHAESVHDFAWMADPFMQTITAPARTAGGEVEVVVYFHEGQRAFAERHLASGVGTIEHLSALLVPYPWSRMTIVDPPPEAASSAGGMEYPTLVTTGVGADAFFAPDGVYLPELVTIHEVGHNWFQGILASNEVDEAWLDEGMNEYVEGVVMHELYGDETSGVDWGPLNVDVFENGPQVDAPFDGQPDPVAQSSYRFADDVSYGTVNYSKTSVALRTFELAVGSDRFRAALHAYAVEMAFHHPTEADLVRVLERELGEDVEWFLRPALHELGAADLRVRSIECHQKHPPSGVFGHGTARQSVASGPAPDAPYLCDVLVENLGRVPVPVDVALELEGGRVVERRWEDRGEGPRWTRLSTEEAEPVVAAEIDPHHRVLLDDGGVRRGLRIEPDGAASTRAAARGQFLTQAAMQAFGL